MEAAYRWGMKKARSEDTCPWKFNIFPTADMRARAFETVSAEEAVRSSAARHHHHCRTPIMPATSAVSTTTHPLSARDLGLALLLCGLVAAVGSLGVS